jgi:hypothetical protein
MNRLKTEAIPASSRKRLNSNVAMSASELVMVRAATGPFGHTLHLADPLDADMATMLLKRFLQETGIA